MNNPLSGKNSTGPRFRFRVRSIAHRTLYLPSSMRSLPEIRRLLAGESPLEVFSCDTIKDVRQVFHRLRCRYDFPFWAALDFRIRDIADSGSIVTLRLNPFQHRLAEILSRIKDKGISSRYIITKSVPRCGLTTCVQAYILWSQLFVRPDHSVTTAPSDMTAEAMKNTVVRCVGREPGLLRVILDRDANSSFFQSFRSPGRLANVPASYFHLADMSKWYDPGCLDSARILSDALRQFDRCRSSMLIIEGDRPDGPKFRLQDHQNLYLSEFNRLTRLDGIVDCPVFADAYAMSLAPFFPSPFLHISFGP